MPETNQKQQPSILRCLYPLVSADLDPEEMPQAFEYLDDEQNNSYCAVEYSVYSDIGV